ncbi:hypothetical protein DITRI_Ditri04bG0048000 [Diplodiscus trichospermus]
MGRHPWCDSTGLKRGPWTPEEDQKLFTYIQQHGHGSWRSLPEKAGQVSHPETFEMQFSFPCLQRCGKSCRLRWINYLRPDIKRGKFSLHEQKTIIQLHALLGNRWAAIAKHLPNRTDNEVKNYWNAHLKKRLANMGIDPVTHKPVGATPGASSSANSYTTVVNIDPIIIHKENATAEESEPRLQQPKSSRSTSASALLLNKLATRVTTLQRIDPLRACQRLQPMSFNRTIGDAGANSENTTAIVCQPTSSCEGSNTSIAPADTSDHWPDNTADPLPTPFNCLDLSNIVLSPESVEYGNASDDGGVSVDTNVEYSLHDALSFLENNASEPPRSVSSCTSARVLNNMASQFESLSCIDELYDWQNNIPPGPIQGDHSDTTTTTADAGVSAGDINVDDMIFDTVGSPVFYNSNYLENELEPSDLFDIP